MALVKRQVPDSLNRGKDNLPLYIPSVGEPDVISRGEKFTSLVWLTDGLVNTSAPEPKPERSSVIRTVKVIVASPVVTFTIEGARVTPAISGGVVSPPDGVGIGVLVGGIVGVGVGVGKGIGVGVGTGGVGVGKGIGVGVGVGGG